MATALQSDIDLRQEVATLRKEQRNSHGLADLLGQHNSGFHLNMRVKIVEIQAEDDAAGYDSDSSEAAIVKQKHGRVYRKAEVGARHETGKNQGDF